MRWIVPLFFIMVMFIVGCEDIIEEYGDPDTAIPDEATEFADQHFDSTLYREQEYIIATTFNLENPFQDEPEVWDTLAWVNKVDFLPVSFFNEMTEARDDGYYKMIGEYPHQFGFGWVDQTNDDPETVEWDGESAYLEEYRTMLGLGREQD